MWIRAKLAKARGYERKNQTDCLDEIFLSAKRAGVLGIFAIPGVFAYKKMSGQKASRKSVQGLVNQFLGPNVGKITQAVETGTKALTPGEEVSMRE